MKTEDISHLRWIHDRFIYVYGENQDVDYLIKLRSIIAELEALQQPKSCEGCEYSSGIHFPNLCLRCTRFKQMKDRYKPKPLS